MRYRSSGNEAVPVAARFETGETVTITVYDLNTGGFPTVALTNDNCTEIGTTGWFVWDSGNITTQPTSYKNLLGVMTDSKGREQGAKFVVGGFPDTIQSIDDGHNSHDDHIKGRRQIDISPPGGWQEVVYDVANDTLEVQRYNLFDQNGAAITSSNNPIVDQTIMIADRRPV